MLKIILVLPCLISIIICFYFTIELYNGLQDYSLLTLIWYAQKQGSL